MLTGQLHAFRYGTLPGLVRLSELGALFLGMRCIRHPFGGLERHIQQADAERHKPQHNLQAVRPVQPGALQLPDVFHVFEGLLYLKPVVVDTDKLSATATEVIRENMPRFFASSAFRTANNSQREAEELYGGIFRR